MLGERRRELDEHLLLLVHAHEAVEDALGVDVLRLGCRLLGREALGAHVGGGAPHEPEHDFELLERRR